MNLLKSYVWKIIFLFISIIGPHCFCLSKKQLLILTYHRILPEGDERIDFEQPGMYVTNKTFALHLGLLQKYFTLVSLNDWLAGMKAGLPLPDKACAITFDDGWQDNYEYAYPLLKQYGIPATIFVVSGFVDSQRDFWPGRLVQLLITIAKLAEKEAFNFIDWIDRNDLSYEFNDKKPATDELDEIIRQCKRYSDDENHLFIDQAWQLLEEKYPQAKEIQHRVTLNQQELQEMIDSGLIEAGSHTCNHIRLLPELNEGVLEHEVVESKQQLERQFSTKVNLFCYPNGDYSPVALNKVMKSYQGACTTVSGWNNSDSSPYLLKRISMHDSMTRTVNGFLAKISGWI